MLEKTIPPPVQNRWQPIADPLKGVALAAASALASARVLATASVLANASVVAHADVSLSADTHFVAGGFHPSARCLREVLNLMP